LGATTTADFYNGMVIRYNGELYTVTEFHHVSPGNWRAFVRVNLKSLRTGRVIELDLFAIKRTGSAIKPNSPGAEGSR